MAKRLYRIQKAAELTGVPAGVIRAWERRYGVVRPRRTGTGYRAYTDVDIALLRRLKQLTVEGVAISAAARLLPELRRTLKEETATPVPLLAESTPLAGWQARVLEAAARLDQPQVGQVLDEALAALPPLAAYGQVLVPLLREVGERWHQGRLSVAVEHLVTHEVRVRLLSFLRVAPRLTGRHVLCACFADEDHELGLLGAALRFRHSGFQVTYLGARTPREQLVNTVQAVKPDIVAISCVNDGGKAKFRAALKAAVNAVPRHVMWVVGGRAAELHEDVCRELGVRLLAGEADFSGLA
ncbi:MAG: MerR family transcriptional regulator [Myxococcaceae bacterium]|nr:MerR family transcriptional regulator [Myxococcaceae bacterium]